VNAWIELKKTWNWLISRASSILALGGIQYLVLSTIAMVLYPGGTKYDPSTTGYSFWNNMLSDMGRTVAHNGVPNAASCALFITTMWILAATFVPFYISLSRRFTATPETVRNARVAVLLGIITGLLLALSASFPQDLFSQLHLRLAQFSFVALAPSTLVYWRLVRGDAGFPRPCAPTFLAFAIIILVGIVVTIASGSGTDAVTVTVQATAQKVIVYAWNACMPVEAWCLWKKIGEKKEKTQ
jgi:hypothetical membrane protein